MERTLDKLAIGGVAAWVGAVSPTRFLNISAEQVVRNLISIRGLHNYNLDDFRNAVLFVESQHHQFPFCELIHDKFTLDR